MAIAEPGESVGDSEPATIAMALPWFRARPECDPLIRAEATRAGEIIFVTR
jgi:hypothetical protein